MAKKIAATEEEKKEDDKVQRDQVWQEAEHENPFDAVFSAKVLETRKNSNGVLYVYFEAYRSDQESIKEPKASLTESDFLKRFEKKVS